MTPRQNSTAHVQGNYDIEEKLEVKRLSVAGHSENTILPAHREFPSRLFVATTTRCNLRCAMCVKQTGGSGIVDGDIFTAIFDALEPALAFAEALILNGIGEPLLHPELENFISKGKSLMPHGSWVGFQINGLLVDENRDLSLVKAGLDRICLSMDSVCPETFREIREGGECGTWRMFYRAGDWGLGTVQPLPYKPASFASFLHAGRLLSIIALSTQYAMRKKPGAPKPAPGTRRMLCFWAIFTNSISSASGDFGNM
jgi:hypothetical protein